MRTVHQGDALDWLADESCLRGASVVTSLPDLSELPELGPTRWRRWFVDAVALVLRRLGDDGVALFYQSDVRLEGHWVDKGGLVEQASEREGAALLFHKIVCRHPPGTVSLGRATYAHLLAFGRAPRAPRHGTPDVLSDGGHRPGTKAMGVKACLLACRFILAETTTRRVVDPFCGYGTVLAVAEHLGLEAVGVDTSARMCRKARTLALEPAWLA